MTKDPVAETQPVLHVVKGAPTDEELAALLAVLAATGGAETSTDQQRPSMTGWAAYWRLVRAPLTPGPGSWRGSALG